MLTHSLPDFAAASGGAGRLIFRQSDFRHCIFAPIDRGRQFVANSVILADLFLPTTIFSGPHQLVFLIHVQCEDAAVGPSFTYLF